MNPVLDAIYERRNIRDFTADLIEGSKGQGWGTDPL